MGTTWLLDPRITNLSFGISRRARSSSSPRAIKVRAPPLIIPETQLLRRIDVVITVACHPHIGILATAGLEKVGSTTRGVYRIRSLKRQYPLLKDPTVRIWVDAVEDAASAEHDSVEVGGEETHASEGYAKGFANGGES